MPGGLLNLVSYGNQNIILNGNPSKTFFKSTYAKYSNFGLQKFRIDYNGLRTLRASEESRFTFKVPRYGDLLMDTYLVVNLPTIWSPIYPPQSNNSNWKPYEFRWIDNLGTQMIKHITFSVGGQIIQRFSGQYMHVLAQRELTNTERDLYNRMTGNIAELNDPANALGRGGNYPNAYYTDDAAGPEPSIRGRKLYIPLNAWFTTTSQMAFPLVSLQYNELHIEVTMRPVRELMTIISPTADTNNRVQPNFVSPLEALYRFLQPPPDERLDILSYTDTRTNWNADVHLISTYCFLGEDEVRMFAEKEQTYLFKEIHEHRHENITGSRRVSLSSSGLVAGYSWCFQRSDSYLRNQWSNYTNWEYSKELPSNLINAPTTGGISVPNIDIGLGPGTDAGETAGIPNSNFITGTFSVRNQKDILENWALIVDGKYRENVLDAGILSYVEKYLHSAGDAPEGIYVYSFSLKNSLRDLQPSGAMNMSKFSNIEFEIKTYLPPLDPNAETFVICDPETEETIGINKPVWRIYDYNYDLVIFEERYNVLKLSSGNAGLAFARA